MNIRKPTQPKSSNQKSLPNLTKTLHRTRGSPIARAFKLAKATRFRRHRHLITLLLRFRRRLLFSSNSIMVRVKIQQHFYIKRFIKAVRGFLSDKYFSTGNNVAGFIKLGRANKFSKHIRDVADQYMTY